MAKTLANFNKTTLSGISGTTEGKIHLDTSNKAIYLDTATSTSVSDTNRICLFRGNWGSTEAFKLLYINNSGNFSTYDGLSLSQTDILPGNDNINLGSSDNKFNNIYATNYHLAEKDIPTLKADKIDRGTFTVDRIPSLPASKISSGDLSNIININASGILSIASNNGTGIYAQNKIELQATNVELTPYIDFCAKKNNNGTISWDATMSNDQPDYSARIICTGKDKLSIMASSGLSLNGPLIMTGNDIGTGTQKVKTIYAKYIGSNGYKVSDIYADNYHLAAEDIPNLDASKITNGTMSSSRIKNQADGISAFKYLGVGGVANTQDRFRVIDGKSYFENTVHIAGKNSNTVAQLTIGRNAHFSGFSNSNNTARVYIDNENGEYTYDFYLNGKAIITDVLKVLKPIETSSDRRLKKNIFNLNNFNNIDKFYDNLIPSVYSFVNDEKQCFGFIAQDVESGLKDLKGDFNIISIPEDLENDFYGLKYEEFIALNTDQIQKLKKRVAEQEDIINYLTTKLEVICSTLGINI